MEHTRESQSLPSSSPLVTHRPPLSAAQRCRIDQNFRAAKAILSRKRSHQKLGNLSHCIAQHARASLSPDHKKHDCFQQPPNSSTMATSMPPANCRDFCASASNFGLKKALNMHTLGSGASALEDFDVRIDILQELDTLCKTRSPLAPLCTNTVVHHIQSMPCGQVQSPSSNESTVILSDSDQIKPDDPIPFSRMKQGSEECLSSSSTLDACISQSESHLEAHSQLMKVMLDSPRQCIMQSNRLIDGGVEEAFFNLSDTILLPTSVPALSNDIDVQEIKISVSSGLPLSSVEATPAYLQPLNASESEALSESSGLFLSSGEAMPTYLQVLNDSQREAVLSDTHKPLLILAGPGSGKTSTMVARLLRLLTEGVHAKNILAMTFTTAAASEMKERVGLHVGKVTSKELNVCTFHSFCLQLCRSHAEKLGRSPEFLVYGRGQQRKAVVEATKLALAEVNGLSKEQNLSDKNADPWMWKERAKKWDKFVTQAKASGACPNDYEKAGNTLGATLLRLYNATLAACNALDYHDLIGCAVALLQEKTEVLEEYKKTWTCILVDEFQDTSTMQYKLLCLLASHKRVTVVGDDDQSIFSFNGANSDNFYCFRRDFCDLKEVRLHQNYRSTRCIVEAASLLIGNNSKRYGDKQALTDNDFGEKITVKECRNDDAQCCFVIDTILMKSQSNSNKLLTYSDYAILYRRQITGKVFQSALRSRKIPFNVHGVAFYRKKIIKAVVAMLWTALNDGNTIHCGRVFKALYSGDKVESKKVVEYIEKVAKASNSDFIEAARSIFMAKVSGRFSRDELARGRKVLSLIDTIHRLVRKERSLSCLITMVMNFMPQKSAFEKRAVVNADDGKLLNEDDDPRTVLEYLLDDVSEFLCHQFTPPVTANGTEEGCLLQLQAFLDFMTSREVGNFRARRMENKNSVTLTTMHQSKGLEWDTVFIVKTNDSEIPLLHETMGALCDGSSSVEEERRLFYVAMTRARKKLYILYVTWDDNHQLLRPTRFLKELPPHVLDVQVDVMMQLTSSLSATSKQLEADADTSAEDTDLHEQYTYCCDQMGNANAALTTSLVDKFELPESTEFLRGFSVESRSMIAALFHTWAKKTSFSGPQPPAQKGVLCSR